jgi:hypothetical protein
VFRDIRELTDSPDADAAELRRRWGGPLGYRYIGRSYESMDLGPEDNTVMFLARGKVGPFRVETEPMVGPDGAVAVRVVIHDEGVGDRITTVASYLFRRVE